MSGHDTVKISGGTTFYLGAGAQPAPRTGRGDAAGLLKVLSDCVDASLAGRPFEPLDVNDARFGPIDAETLHDVLGEGEIRLWVSEPGLVTEITESAMPGVWRVSRRTETGEPVSDTIDVGSFPRLVDMVMDRDTLTEIRMETIPEGTFSAGPIIQEIRYHMMEGNPHTIVLTNLPMSPDDMILLNRVLGQGPVAGGSKGYSTTRVRSTFYRRVWRVNYLNSDGQTIYDAIEITQAPLSLAAPREDIEDGRDRLADLLKIYS